MHRLFVSYNIPDARGKTKLKQFNALGLKTKVGAVYLADCYTIDAKLDKRQLEKAKTLLTNPQIQTADKSANYTSPFAKASGDILPFSHAIQIAYLPGVTDNVGHTAKETLSDGARVKFKPDQNVYSSQVLFISFDKPSPNPSLEGRGMEQDIQTIASSLHNPLIQKAIITSYAEFKKSGLPIFLPKVKLIDSSKVSLVDLNLSDAELEKIGKLGILDYHPPLTPPSKGGETAGRHVPIPSNPEKGSVPIPSPSRGGLGRGDQARRGPLALSLTELQTIRDHFNNLNRKPTDIELETLAQTWSEHCKHTIFADPIDDIKDGLFKHYIRRATEEIRKQKSMPLEGHPRGNKTPENIGDFCVSVFSDNAGGISFDDDYIIAHKVETHNTPSALDPFGGAITGIVGVNRDALGFGLGAKPVANFYGFCLAEPNDKSILFRDKDLQIPMLSARRIMDGVIAGINAGGNQSGIPTPLGFLYFDHRYRGKPLVFAGTIGLLPKKVGGKKAWIKQAKPDDLIVMIGGRVGADGIHGATFSSEGLDANSPATAVQIGDPITQKKLSDAICKEARDLGLYNSITDCGAGGISSAVGEMAKESGGCEVAIDKVPLKYPGLSPWQIWISESQERMVLAVPKKNWKKFERLMKSRGVEASVIGKFTNSKKCVVKHGTKIVMDLEMEFLHNGRPAKHLITKKPELLSTPSRASARDPFPKQASKGSDSSAALGMADDSKILNPKSYILNLLSSPNLTSTEFLATQYDHEVQGSSVIKPLQGAGKINNDASVFSPVLNSKKAVVTSYGLAPSLSETNPYYMAQVSIDNAVRAAVAAGANIDYLAILDNFCWCSSNEPERLWQLKEAVRAAYDTAVAYGTPFVSGKDSMFNDFKGFSADGRKINISIPPTLLITTLGVIPDKTKALSIDAKMAGDVLYLLNNNVDEFNAQKNLSIYRAVYQAAQANLIASSISINQGGLVIALAKKLMAGNLGAQVKLVKPSRKSLSASETFRDPELSLFDETPGRILVSVDPKKAKQFEKIFSKHQFTKIGRVTSEKTLSISNGKKTILDLKISEMLNKYKEPFKNF